MSTDPRVSDFPSREAARVHCRQPHICGDPNSPCDSNCVDDALAVREAEKARESTNPLDRPYVFNPHPHRWAQFCLHCHYSNFLPTPYCGWCGKPMRYTGNLPDPVQTHRNLVDTDPTLKATPVGPAPVPAPAAPGKMEEFNEHESWAPEAPPVCTSPLPCPCCGSVTGPEWQDDHSMLCDCVCMWFPERRAPCPTCVDKDKTIAILEGCDHA